MTKVNYHMHTTGSDGELSPRQVIEEAIKAGIKHICLTDHYNYPKEVVDHTHPKISNTEEYHQEIIKLKEEFKGKIDLSFGMEFDFLNGHQDYTKAEISKRDYDFIIGSIHTLPKGREFYLLPWAVKEWTAFSERFGGIKEAIELYYEQTKKLIKSGLYDCVGHLDTIKNSYPGDWKEIENQEWYKNIVLDVLDEIKKSKMCMEINTSGLLSYAKEQYPSKWIIVEAKKRNIPLTIGSDFHRDKNRPNQRVDSELSEAIALAKKVGYKSILIFKKSKPIEVEI